MTDDWQYTTEPVGDPHALCCRQCKADREALITTRQALAEVQRLRWDINRPALVRLEEADAIARRALAADGDTAQPRSFTGDPIQPLTDRGIITGAETERNRLGADGGTKEPA